MIHILWATIRPYTFLNVYKIWRDTASKSITTHVAVNTQQDADIIQKALNEKDRVVVVKTDRKGVCYPSYMLSSTLEGEKNDIVVFASDDFTPPMDWDNYLIEKLKNREGCLMVRDGYQLPDSSNMKDPCITIPIMTYGCLEKLNKVIYHPAYNHMHSDAELYMNLKDLGLLIDERMTDTTVFEHHHWAAGKRNPDQNDAQYNNKWAEDEATWNKRTKMKVEDRIKI